MKRRGATRATYVDEVGVSLPRRISGKVILVISGPGRMMTFFRAYAPLFPAFLKVFHGN